MSNRMSEFARFYEKVFCECDGEETFVSVMLKTIPKLHLVILTERLPSDTKLYFCEEGP